jgi:hypothetical protein
MAYNQAEYLANLAKSGSYIKPAPSAEDQMRSRALAAGFASVFSPNTQIKLDSGGAFSSNWTNKDIGSSSPPAALMSWISEPQKWTTVSSGGWKYTGSQTQTYSPAPPSYHPPVTYYPPPPPPPPPPQAPPSPGPAPTFTRETQKELVKYEYVYGIKDLRITGNEFAEKSIYVSKPMEIDGNVMQVSIQAIEEHPLFSSTSGESAERQTSVEYYISYVDNPSQEDWYPILPEGEKEILCELLIFDTARTATLRFPALTYSDPTPKVFKDGIEFKDWAFTGGGMKVQLLVDQAVGSIYTIRYTPNTEIVDPWILDIHEQGLKLAKQTDVFSQGTSHNKTVTLSKYPYLNYDVINTSDVFDANGVDYRPIGVTLRNANIAAPNKVILKEILPQIGSSLEARTLNVTDYKTRKPMAPKIYSLDKIAPYNKFEYVHEGKKLTFSETFNKAEVITNQDVNHGNAEIVVEYDYLVSNFRVKIILRRTGPGVNSVSPNVHQYTLKYKVMK